MFESLTEKLQNTFKKLSGHGKLTEKNITDALREVRLALLEADVNFKIVRSFINDVREQALGQEVMGSLTPELQIAKIIGDELTKLMGTASEKINIAPSGPTIIMMVGLNGAGKTTVSAKLALKFRTEGRNPLLVAADVYRPAAIKQLQVLGDQINVPVFSMGTDTSPVSIAQAAVKSALNRGHNFVIIDTAGRLQINKELMKELRVIKGAINPTEIMLVVDAMTGQDAINVAEQFNADLDIDGVILTKMDGDARGGAALSIRAVIQKPIKLVSVGEKVDTTTLEEFHPDRMASRILGEGDFKTLLEKAENVFTEDQAREFERKLTDKQGLDFDDLLVQLEQIKKMGPLDQLIDMIPGINKLPIDVKDLQVDEGQFQHAKAIIQSMTPGERRIPSLLDRSRKIRIAKGSGMTVREVNQLVQQLNFMNRMVKHQGLGMPKFTPGKPKLSTKQKKVRKPRKRKKRRSRR
ncbi:signal recognition particle protein [Candidatus Poribacteria bacterium]|nr:signal recognition particle protein [Candidatus Poribacteria bacterium]